MFLLKSNLCKAFFLAFSLNFFLNFVFEKISIIFSAIAFSFSGTTRKPFSPFIITYFIAPRFDAMQAFPQACPEISVRERDSIAMLGWRKTSHTE